MSDAPLLRLGRMELDQGLRAAPDGSGLIATATVEVPESVSERQYAWDVAWADAVRQAGELGADHRTAQALAAGAGQVRAGGSKVVVAAHGEVLLARWLPAGAAAGSVRAGPLPHLLEVAVAAARRPAHVVILADRDSAAVIAHDAGDQHPPRRFPVGARPGAQRDPHPGRPPALHHGERHLTGPEPESGGEQNAEFIAARTADVAGSVGAHIVLGAGDRHILAAVSKHLPESLGPITTIASGPSVPMDDGELGAEIGAALDEITAAAIAEVGDLVAAGAAGPEPAAVLGVAAVAEQLTEQQVAVLLVGPDLPPEAADGLVWAALQQDAIVARRPEGTAALLRR
jgi:hypothetical protein